METLRENKMGTAPVFKLIMSMALPSMFSMIVQALYNIVDSIFVAQISENALTAVSLALPLQLLIVSVGVGMGVGLNSLVSRRLGEGKQEEANSAATHGIILAFCHWIIFLILGLVISGPFLSLYTDNTEIFNMGKDYLGIVMIFSFGCFIEIAIEKTLQATGNMIFPMLFMLSGAITNIILDPIFIFSLGFGVSGAAIATVIGQIVSMVFALIVLFVRKHAVHVTFKNFKINLKTIKNIYAVGLPSMIMQSIGSVMIVGMNGILVVFSNTAVSIFGIYFKLQSFIFMPVFGLTHGVMPVLGYNYGARNKDRMLKAQKFGCLIAMVIMAIGTVIFWVAPRLLLNMFNAGPEMQEQGQLALRILSICFVPAAIGIMFSTFFQATGRGMRSLFISILRQLVVLLPAAYLLSLTGNLDFVWFSFPIAESVSLITAIVLFIHLLKTDINKLTPREKA